MTGELDAAVRGSVRESEEREMGLLGRDPAQVVVRMAARLEEQAARIAELERRVADDNAVCVCGCLTEDHESCDDGESCGHDDHDCLRACAAVADVVRTICTERDKLKAELAGYQDHEAQTHVKLGAILGTDDSLEVLAWRLKMDLRTVRQDAREFARAIDCALDEARNGDYLTAPERAIAALKSVDTSNYVDGGE